MSKVIVIGRNYTSRLGMIRALGKVGHEIIVLKTNGNTKDIDSFSKYVSKYDYAQEPDREELIRKIKFYADPSTKIVLIPVDDFAASTIDENIDELKGSFLMPSIDNKSGEINKLMDKDVQKRIAKQSNLNVANGWVITVENKRYTIPSDIVYPCFPKPQVSFMGNKRCMRRCNNEKELRDAINTVIERFPNCPFIIEQYIKIEKEYATLGFSDGKHVVMPAMIQLIRDGSGPHKGVTMQGRILPASEFRGTLDKFSDFIRSLNYVGLFDIDSYESGGVIYFNELNLRFGASGYAITASGINLPEMFVNYLLSKDVNYDKSFQDSCLFVNEKVAFDDLKGGYITYSEYKKIVNESNLQFILSNDDIMPFKKFLSLFKIITTILRVYIRKLVK